MTSATDETGRSLVDALSPRAEWEKVRLNEEKKTASASIKLDNPARTSQTLPEVTGTIELYHPARDAHSTLLSAAIGGQRGHTLRNPDFKASGLEIASLDQGQWENYQKSVATSIEDQPQLSRNLKLRASFLLQLTALTKVDDHHLVLLVRDPEQRLVDIELETAAGKLIKFESQSSIGVVGSDQQAKIYKFKAAIPADARLKIYVATPQSIAKIPFRLTAVPLP